MASATNNVLNLSDAAPTPATSVGLLSAISLGNVLDQSVDCVKLINLDGTVEYMNANGMCAMEIDHFLAVKGQQWADLWPADARSHISDAYDLAKTAKVARFRAFCPTAKGAPRWWDVSVSTVNSATNALAGFLAVSRDVTSEHANAEALRIASDELKHRLKNTYQTISSLLLLNAMGNAEHEAFAAQMAARVGALSRAQTLFADGTGPCKLDELIPTLVLPFTSERVEIAFGELPRVRISQPQADAVALVIGELAVNASKYGALVHGGAIKVHAEATVGHLAIVWNERSNRPVQQISRDGGQGMDLMSQIMATRGGEFTVAWEADGLRATLGFKLA